MTYLVFLLNRISMSINQSISQSTFI